MSLSGPSCVPDRATVDTDERDLIRRICDGETELYYELVRPHERPVYLAAYALLRNEADAEDAAQEAILKALRHLKQFRAESRFRTWLIQIAINEARMRLRSARRELLTLDEDLDDGEGDYIPKEVEDWREIPSETLERKEIRELLTSALSQLSPKYREVLVLRDVQQLSIAETAQALGVGEGLVKVRLLRARLRMRDALAPVLRNSSILSHRWFKRGKSLW